jgi:putative DNA primase/helicase
MRERTEERAHGRWPGILRELGVDARFLNRKGPCPVCGGRDRFRFSNKGGDGWSYCQHCGPGPGIVLLRRLHGWNHATACAEVDRVLDGPNPPPKRQEDAVMPDSHKKAMLSRLLRDAEKSEAKYVVVEELERLGLAVTSPMLFGHDECPYYNENRQLVGKFEAIVVPVQAPDGTVIAAQRRYLSDEVPKEDRKKLTPVCGRLDGAASRLHPVRDGMLCVAEGITSALASYELFGVPTWSAISAGNLKLFVPPFELRHLIIFGDNDRNFVGQAAAYALAERVHTAGKVLKIEVRIPERPGSDWRDVLNERKAGAS